MAPELLLGGVPDVSADLYAAGLRSFASVQLMLALEEAFEVEFPESLLNRQSFQINRRTGYVFSSLFPILNMVAGVGTAALQILRLAGVKLPAGLPDFTTVLAYGGQTGGDSGRVPTDPRDHRAGAVLGCAPQGSSAVRPRGWYSTASVSPPCAPAERRGCRRVAASMASETGW